MAAPLTVLVADAEATRRRDLAEALAVPGLDLAVLADDADSAVAGARSTAPEVCLLDGDLPGGVLLATAAIAADRPDTKIVIMSAAPTAADVVAALRAGASGVLPRAMDLGRLPATLLGTRRGEAPMPRALVAHLVEELRHHDRDPLRVPVGWADQVAAVGGRLGVAPPDVAPAPERRAAGLPEDVGGSEPAVARPRTGRSPDLLVVDGRSLHGRGTALVLAAEGLVAEVVTVASVDALVRAARSLSPPVVLLPVRGHGLAEPTPVVVGALRSLVATVVVHGTGGDDLALAECLEAGAEGVVADGHDLEALLEVVRRAVRADGPVMRAGRRDDLLAELRRHRRDTEVRWAPFTALSRREAAVLQALVDGASAEAIAERFYVSLATVRSHIRGVLVKLGVNSQVAAVAAANRVGWRGEEAKHLADGARPQVHQS